MNQKATKKKYKYTRNLVRQETEFKQKHTSDLDWGKEASVGEAGGHLAYQG